MKTKRLILSTILVVMTAMTDPIILAQDGSDDIIKIQGKVYYIDATNGNDQNDGLSRENAWKTLSMIRKVVLMPGDNILLKRGESWPAENLTIGNSVDQTLKLSNGSINNPIVISVYGSGENPKVYMLTLNRIGHVSVQNLTVTKRIVDSEYPVKVQYCNNILIKNCSFPGMYTDYSKYVTFRRVISSNNEMEHGLYICQESKCINVEYCTFANNKGSGIQTNGRDMDSIVIKGCLIYGNGNATNGGSGYNDVNSHNVTLIRNIFINGFGKAVESMNANSKRYFNNVFVTNQSGIPAVGLSNVDSSMVFNNNIFYVVTDAISGINANVKSDVNCFYAINKVDHKPTINWGTSLDSWIKSSGNDLHSLSIDPKFNFIELDTTSPSLWDLRLKDSSKLIDAGLDAGVVSFEGYAPDIGAAEWSNAVPIDSDYFKIIDVSLCTGKSYFAGGKFQTETGTYEDKFESYNGYDSIVQTKLKFYTLRENIVNASICKGESYFAAGAGQTVAGTYFDTLKTKDGCDSIVVTFLTVIAALYDSVFYLTVCDIPQNTISFKYEYDTLEPLHGCDRIKVRVYESYIGGNTVKSSDNEFLPYVYPNPVTESFIISNIKNGSLLCIIDLKGRQILTRIVNNYDQINTNNLASGLYILKVKNKQGSYEQKLLKY